MYNFDFDSNELNYKNPIVESDSSNVFDPHNPLSPSDYLLTYVYGGEDNVSILQHKNPLSICENYHVKPVKIHHVKPHYVKGYYREDGTYVAGYFRGGEDGTGYIRSNPDDTITNNLNYLKE